MSSKFTCVCGSTVRTNLYEGHGLGLLVPEEHTDLSGQELSQTCETLIDKLVQQSAVVAKCQNCGVLAVVNNEYSIKLYAPVPQ